MFRLPGAGNRKSSPERTLLAARAKLGRLLDTHDVKAATQEELEQIERMLRTVEGKLRTSRMHLKQALLTPMSGTDDPADSSAKLIGQELMRVYTECDLDAAETNIIARAKSKQNLIQHRQSTEQLNLKLAEVVRDKDAMSHLDAAGTLDFDALSFAALPVVANLPIFVSFVWVEQKQHIVKDLGRADMISDSNEFKRSLLHFLESIDHNYKKNPYHNGAHGADTMLTFDWFFQCEFLKDQTSALDHLMGLVAGAIHDVGHPGQNNMFQIKTMSELAIRYNDKSVLENMHVARAFEIMQECDNNWLVQLRKDFQSDGTTGNLQQYTRRGLIDLVLATDPAKHGNQVKELAQIAADDDDDANGGDKKVEALEQKLFILGTLLHAADVSNPVRPQGIMLKWTNVLLTEFWDQGDEERVLGQPVSPLCDRQAGMLEVPKGQIGFINFVIEPLYKTIATLIPETKEAMDNLLKNKEFWQQKHIENTPFDQLFMR